MIFQGLLVSLPAMTTLNTLDTDISQKVKLLSSFYNIGKTITSSLEINQVLKVIMDKITEVIEPGGWSLLSLDEETSELKFEIFVPFEKDAGPSKEEISKIRLRLGEGIAGWVAQKGEALIVSDVSKDPRFCGKVDDSIKFKTQAVLCVPMIARGKVLGVIELINHTKKDDQIVPFTEQDKEVLMGFADYAAIAIENANNFKRIQELSITDDLTGLFNSRYMHEALDRQIEHANKSGEEFTIIFLDLDYFKEVTDNYGHLTGSKVLGEVGKEIKRNLKPGDYGFRYGGDEFMVVMVRTRKDGALDRAQALRKAIKSTNFGKDMDMEIYVSASFGLATFPTDADDKEGIIRKADEAMYAVKESTKDGIKQA